MKNAFLICLLTLALSLSACVPIAPTPTPVPDQPVITATGIASPEVSGYPLPGDGPKDPPQQDPVDSYPLPTDQTIVGAYPEPQIPVMRPETRFANEIVDRILDALFLTPDQLNSLVVYTKAPCTTADGLGGPPKCEPDQAEGTIVEGLPVLGSEGHFTPKSDQVLAFLAGQVDLLGVFKVVEDFRSEEYYPAGQYGIVLNQKDSGSVIVLRITADGIVRLDYPSQIPGKEQTDLESYLNPQP